MRQKKAIRFLESYFSNEKPKWGGEEEFILNRYKEALVGNNEFNPFRETKTGIAFWIRGIHLKEALKRNLNVVLIPGTEILENLTRREILKGVRKGIINPYTATIQGRIKISDVKKYLTEYEIEKLSKSKVVTKTKEGIKVSKVYVNELLVIYKDSPNILATMIVNLKTFIKFFEKLSEEDRNNKKLIPFIRNCLFGKQKCVDNAIKKLSELNVDLSFNNNLLLRTYLLTPYDKDFKSNSYVMDKVRKYIKKYNSKNFIRRWLYDRKHYFLPKYDKGYYFSR